MNPRLSRLTLAAATTVALGLGAVACTGGDADPAPSKTTAGAASGGGTGGAAGASPARSSTAPVPAATGGDQAASRWHTSELKADVQIQPDRPGSAMVMLLNKGTRTCTVFGYPGFGGLLADNSRIDVTTARVAQPGPPTPITLRDRGHVTWPPPSARTCSGTDGPSTRLCRVGMTRCAEAKPVPGAAPTTGRVQLE